MSVRYSNGCLEQYVRQYLRHRLRYYQQKSNFCKRIIHSTHVYKMG